MTAQARKQQKRANNPRSSRCCCAKKRNAKNGIAAATPQPATPSAPIEPPAYETLEDTRFAEMSEDEKESLVEEVDSVINKEKEMY